MPEHATERVEPRKRDIARANLDSDEGVEEGRAQLHQSHEDHSRLS